MLKLVIVLILGLIYAVAAPVIFLPAKIPDNIGFQVVSEESIRAAWEMSSMVMTSWFTGVDGTTTWSEFMTHMSGGSTYSPNREVNPANLAGAVLLATVVSAFLLFMLGATIGALPLVGLMIIACLGGWFLIQLPFGAVWLLLFPPAGGNGGFTRVVLAMLAAGPLTGFASARLAKML